MRISENRRRPQRRPGEGNPCNLRHASAPNQTSCRIQKSGLSARGTSASFPGYQKRLSAQACHIRKFDKPPRRPPFVMAALDAATLAPLTPLVMVRLDRTTQRRRVCGANDSHTAAPHTPFVMAALDAATRESKPRKCEALSGGRRVCGANDANMSTPCFARNTPLRCARTWASCCTEQKLSR